MKVSVSLWVLQEADTKVGLVGKRFTGESRREHKQAARAFRESDRSNICEMEEPQTAATVLTRSQIGEWGSPSSRGLLTESCIGQE